ncbi:hypothetical protein [Mailhella sp.]|uniref:hypothetical protein n=1 Tax=Mailhella sp. TaxID=1981029 RepID=UPI003AB154CE
MTGEEIYQFTQDTLCAMARAAGVGVEFMEPIVLMGKLRIHKTPEKDDAYYWQQTLLLRVHRERVEQGTEWTFFDASGKELVRLLQEKTHNN